MLPDDFENPDASELHAAVQRRRKRMLGFVLGALGGVVFALLAGLAIRAHLEHRTPHYALGKVREALATHDRALFYEYVDVDTLLSRAIDDALAVQEELNPGTAPDTLTAGLVAMMKPKLLETMRAQLDRRIEATSDAATAASEKAMAFVGQAPSARIVGESAEGQIATLRLGFSVPHKEDELVVELHLREAGGHLQFCEVANMKDVARELYHVDHDWKWTENRAAARKLKELVDPQSVRIERDNDDWDVRRWVAYEVAFKNDSDEEIRDIRLHLLVHDPGGGIVINEDATFSSGVVPAHATRTLRSWRYLERNTADQRIWSANLRTYSPIADTLSAHVGARVEAIPFPEVLAEAWK